MVARSSNADRDSVAGQSSCAAEGSDYSKDRADNHSAASAASANTRYAAGAYHTPHCACYAAAAASAACSSASHASCPARACVNADYAANSASSENWVDIYPAAAIEAE